MKQGLISAVLLVAVCAMQAAYADEADNFWGWLLEFKRTKGVEPVANAQYEEECGSCHFAYQPGLLPARSWEKLLTGSALQDHFGENAELDADTLRVVHDYAVAHAADKSHYKRSRKIAHATENGEAPLRISEVSYFKRVHEKLSDDMVRNNAGVKSISNCDKCHTGAVDGVYDDDTVAIPNFPDWRD